MKWLLVELGNLLSYVSSRHKFVRFAREIAVNPDTRVVTGSSEILGRALELYATRPDKSWSLTDCTSFVVMRDESLADALTFDRHFEQAGFGTLLK